MTLHNVPFIRGDKTITVSTVEVVLVNNAKSLRDSGFQLLHLYNHIAFPDINEVDALAIGQLTDEERIQLVTAAISA